MEDSAQIFSYILGLLPYPATQVAGAGLQFSLGKWQEQNLNKFKTHVEFQFKTLNQRKIDRSYLYSDQFKELLLGFIEGASKTASDVKHKAFANALKNSVYGLSSGFSDRPTLQRILLQMSEGEIEALLALFEKTKNTNNENGEIKYKAKGVSTLHNWSEDDTYAALLSLAGLGLAEGGPYSSNDDGTIWQATTLARRLAVWCSESDTEPVNTI
jgi:hypothetical protein